MGEEAINAIDDADDAPAAPTPTSTPSNNSENNEVVSEAASNFSLTVSNGPRGHLARIRCVARFPVAPETIFAVLTNADNAGVFRDVADCCSREILSEEPKGNRSQNRENSVALLRVVQVEQLGKVRLGGPGPLGREVTFRTELRVTEDAREGPEKFSTRFELLRSDVLSTFDGTWTLETKVEEGHSEITTTVATLEQDVTPKGVPRWLKFVPLAGRAIKGACAGAVRRMVEDLASVADAVALEGKTLVSVLEECRRRARKGKGEKKKEEEEVGVAAG